MTQQRFMFINPAIYMCVCSNFCWYLSTFINNARTSVVIYLRSLTMLEPL